MEASLRRIAPLLDAPSAELVALHRLSGGASKETWSFDLKTAAQTRPFILRRAPSGVRPDDPSIAIETEAELMSLSARRGVPVPTVRHVLRSEDGLGRGYIMDRVAGETLARRILRDPSFAAARARFAQDSGGILARIHSVDASSAALRTTTPAAHVEEIALRYRRCALPRPVFDLALRWLRQNLPAPVPPRLVHGDFRNGNLIFGPEGVRAVLDWELAHRGDPMEDIGWLCINSWRFGAIDHPVGGIADREALYAAYEAQSDSAVDRAAVHFWEILGTLRWGSFCAAMVEWVRSGEDRSVERVMIARRASETEIDLLRLLVPREDARAG